MGHLLSVEFDLLYLLFHTRISQKPRSSFFLHIPWIQLTILLDVSSRTTIYMHSLDVSKKWCAMGLPSDDEHTSEQGQQDNDDDDIDLENEDDNKVDTDTPSAAQRSVASSAPPVPSTPVLLTPELQSLERSQLTVLHHRFWVQPVSVWWQKRHAAPSLMHASTRLCQLTKKSWVRFLISWIEMFT